MGICRFQTVCVRSGDFSDNIAIADKAVLFNGTKDSAQPIWFVVGVIDPIETFPPKAHFPLGTSRIELFGHAQNHVPNSEQLTDREIVVTQVHIKAKRIARMRNCVAIAPNRIQHAG